MKKKFLLIVSAFMLTVLAAGCGKKEVEEVVQQPQPTVAPVVVEPEVTQPVDLVEMQVSTEPLDVNVIGEKTATAAKVMIINKTGDEISSIYVRPHPEYDTDDWGDELIQGKFKLKDAEKATYYFEKGTSSLYDIRIVYTDPDRSECYFRKLPLNNIREISLLMEEIYGSNIPYAKYFSGNSTKEISTLQEVKQRLGIYDDESYYDDEEDEEEENVTPTPAPTVTPVPEQEQQGGYNDPYEGTTDPGINAAAGCIGQSLDTLIGLVGEPSQSDYENEPETGETGYHYYDNFTVSTTVDENGNEIVAGIW